LLVLGKSPLQDYFLSPHKSPKMVWDHEIVITPPQAKQSRRHMSLRSLYCDGRVSGRVTRKMIILGKVDGRVLSAWFRQQATCPGLDYYKEICMCRISWDIGRDGSQSGHQWSDCDTQRMRSDSKKLDLPCKFGLRGSASLTFLARIF
jgi:hypothetical protein